MKKVTFITGNQKKADFLSRHLGLEIPHEKINLDEIQSLELEAIVKHKAEEAYRKLAQPVLVEDISFSIDALGGKLPGPFIKWFIEEVGYEQLCRLADADPNRGATTSVCYGYFDGDVLKLFSGSQRGTIPKNPRGSDGFGWNAIFIPDGSTKTNAEMTEAETERYSLRTTTVYPAIKEFLESIE